MNDLPENSENLLPKKISVKSVAARISETAKIIGGIGAISAFFALTYGALFKDQVDETLRSEIIRLLAGPSRSGQGFFNELALEQEATFQSENFVEIILENQERIASWQEAFDADRNQVDTVVAFNLRRIVQRLENENGGQILDEEERPIFEEIERTMYRTVFLSPSESYHLFVIPNRRYIPPLCEGLDCRGRLVQDDQATFRLGIGTGSIPIPPGNRIPGLDVTCPVRDAVLQTPSRMIGFSIHAQEIGPTSVDYEFDFDVVIIASKAPSSEEC